MSESETDQVKAAAERGEAQVTLTDEFSFKVPKGHAEEGAEKSGNFDFLQVTGYEAAVAYINEKVKEGNEEWDLTNLVNNKIKGNARAAAYQKAVMAYKPADLTVDEVKEKTIKSLIRTGMSEAAANEAVSRMFPSA